MKRIRAVCARHTQTGWNAQKRYSGWRNPRLNRKGREQAGDLLVLLRNMPLIAAFCSDQRRCFEMTRIITLVHPKVMIVKDARLREVCVGQMEGLTKEKAKQRFNSPEYSTHHPHFDFRPIGGESRAEALKRYCSFFDETTENFGTQEEPHPFIFVGVHGTLFRVLLEAKFPVLSPHGQGEYQVLAYPPI